MTANTALQPTAQPLRGFASAELGRSRSMHILLLALLLAAATTASADCTSNSECAAIQLWRTAERVTVEISRNDKKTIPTKAMLHSRGQETLLSFQQDNTSVRVLAIPGNAMLYSGLPPGTTCDSTGDTATIILGMVATPLGYLAKAMPMGPQQISSATTRKIAVSPGRMYIDPGNFVEIKRPLTIEATVTPQADGIRFEVLERATSLIGGGGTTIYSGSWEAKASSAFPQDNDFLSAWLVCPRSEISLVGFNTLGQLRSKGRSIER